MPSDSLRLTAFVNKAGLNNGLVDIGAEQYKARNFEITNSTFAYDGNYATPEQGLDFSHISLTNLNTSIDSILYQGKEINAHIKEFSWKNVPASRFRHWQEMSGVTMNR